MHIPDGMLSAPVLAASGVASAGFIAYAVSWVRRHLAERRVVLMAVLAALVFALQMLNFAVAGGTSGHFTGGAAAAILLGPWPAAIVMTTVLAVQALLFQDGGIIAFGANVLNLAVIGPFVGYAVWRAATRLRPGRAGNLTGSFAGAWAASVVAALAVAIEVWASGRARLELVVGAMGFWHALIGIGEGLITAGLIGYLLGVRPDLLQRDGDEQTGGVRGVAVSLGLLALAAAGLSFLASDKPDGLEFVYFEQGIGERFQPVSLIPSPLRDYAVPGLTSDRVAVALAGLVGLIVTGALLYTALRSAMMRRRGGSE